MNELPLNLQLRELFGDDGLLVNGRRCRLVLSETGPDGGDRISAGGRPILENRQKGGSPLILTGQTDAVALELLDFSQYGFKAGDSIQIESIWSYTANTNNKVITLAWGADGLTATSLLSTTRNVSGENTFVAANRLWFHSETEFFAHPSFLTPYGPTTTAITLHSLNPDTNKLFFRASLANSADTITLRGYSIKVERGTA